MSTNQHPDIAHAAAAVCRHLTDNDHHDIAKTVVQALYDSAEIHYAEAQHIADAFDLGDVRCDDPEDDEPGDEREWDDPNMGGVDREAR